MGRVFREYIDSENVIKCSCQTHMIDLAHIKVQKIQTAEGECFYSETEPCNVYCVERDFGYLLKTANLYLYDSCAAISSDANYDIFCKGCNIQMGFAFKNIYMLFIHQLVL